MIDIQKGLSQQQVQQLFDLGDAAYVRNREWRA